MTSLEDCRPASPDWVAKTPNPSKAIAGRIRSRSVAWAVNFGPRLRLRWARIDRRIASVGHKPPPSGLEHAQPTRPHGWIVPLGSLGAVVHLAADLVGRRVSLVHHMRDQ